MKKLLLLFFLSAFPCFAQNVTYDTSATDNTDTAGTGATLSLTVGSNSNRVLIVCAAMTGSSGASGISALDWNGGAQTGSLVKAQGNAQTGVNTEMWIIKNPDTGTHDVTISESPDSGIIWYGAISLYNVNQTTSTADPLGETVTSGTSLSLTPTTVSGDMAVDCWGLVSSAAGTNTPGGGQTTRVNYDYGGPTNAMMGSTEAATGSSTAMTWTLGSDASFLVEVGHVAAAIKKVSSATSPVALRRHRN